LIAGATAPLSTSATSASSPPPIINITWVVQTIRNVGGILNIGDTNVQVCQQTNASCTSSVTPAP
jgi:hypothetical protein